MYGRVMSQMHVPFKLTTPGIALHISFVEDLEFQDLWPDYIESNVPVIVQMHLR
jgi:hypothetical protein